MPSVLVPSGNSAIWSPLASRSSSAASCRFASAGRRSMNIVPIARPISPTPGHSRTSALDTRNGAAARCSATMSIQLEWLATKAPPPRIGVPRWT